MKYVKVFEAWTEEKEEEFSHEELYGILEDLVDAWKEWKENEDEDKDEEELHDAFMIKVEDIIEKAKEIVEEEEEEEEETSDESEGEAKEEEVEEESEEEVEEVEEGKVDLSTKEGSLSNLLEPLIPVMATMSFDELKDAFMAVLSSPELKASQMTRSKWIQRAEQMMSKRQLMHTITNIYLRGSGLGSNPKDY